MKGRDYYPFGAPMPGRGFSSSIGYRYGFNGQEKDAEIGGSGNSYTAEFWQYDSRLGRRWNIDPVDQISISNYATFANNPIRLNDPTGANPKPGDPNLKLNAGAKTTWTIGKRSSLNFSLFAGVTYQTGFMTTGLNLSGTYYRGGPGTSQGSGASSKYSPNLFTGSFSPSVTFGSGKGSDHILNTFNSFSGSGVYTNYKNSITFGQNLILSSGKTSVSDYNRNQRTSYLGITVGDVFTFGHANDVKRLPFWGDGNDEFFSAYLHAGLNYSGFSLNYSNTMYYGKSNSNAQYSDDKIINGLNYDDQMGYDSWLNNAQETISFGVPSSFTNGVPVTLGIGRSGKGAMWPSNRMHNTIPDPTDPTKHFHYLPVPYHNSMNVTITAQPNTGN